MKGENSLRAVLAMAMAMVLVGVLGIAGCQSERGGDAEGGEESVAGSPVVRAPTGEIDGGVDGAGSPVVRAPTGGGDESVESSGGGDGVSGPGSVSGGKPAAPIDIRYTVIGTASVGQPVNIEIDVRSTLRDAPITLDYRINDPRELAFDEAQPRRVELRTASDTGDVAAARRQVIVIPQREGRAYLNVSASIATADGSMMRSIAIPVQVGRSRSEPAVNGELQQDADGETVISMPAEEN